MPVGRTQRAARYGPDPRPQRRATDEGSEPFQTGRVIFVRLQG